MVSLNSSSCILHFLIQNQSSIQTVNTDLRTVLLSTCLGPVLRHPALIIMETQVPTSIQQWTQQPRITGENCSMDGGTSIITAAGGYEHHTWNNMLFSHLNQLHGWLWESFGLTDLGLLHTVEASLLHWQNRGEMHKRVVSVQGDSYCQLPLLWKM